MKDDWIYIGADSDKPNWSKVGKTTRGLKERHRSSRNPTYLIYNGYKIIEGDVHEIESELLKKLDSSVGYHRISHVSTGNASECFKISPKKMIEHVERFIEERYPNSVSYDHLSNEMNKYECPDGYRKNSEQENDPWINDGFDKPQESMEISKDGYVSGNKVRHEADLGDGYFIDFETGMQGYRYEDGTVEWRDHD